MTDPRGVSIADVPRYVECTIIHPDGSTRRGNVRYVKLMTVDEARMMLSAGRVAWVAPGDVAEVVGDDRP